MISAKSAIIKINPRLIDIRQIEIIAKTLREDGVITYPTDTFYGLGGNCFSMRAIKKIYLLKEREPGKPLPIVISDIDMLNLVAVDIPVSFWALSQKFWPGALTIILKASAEVPEEILGPGRSLGIRLPNFPWLRALIRQAGFPLTATSANKSGKKEISLPKKIIEIFSDKVELIVDGGKTSGVLPSTLIDLTQKKPKVLREGSIPSAELDIYLRTL